MLSEVSAKSQPLDVLEISSFGFDVLAINQADKSECWKLNPKSHSRE